MKTFVLIKLTILALITSTSVTAIARNPVLKGKVVNENNEAASFASVVLKGEGDRQAAGMVTGEDGIFEFDAPKGEYTLSVSFLGYEPYSTHLILESDTEMEAIALLSASTEIEAVEVTGRFITRDADRFVVNLANNPVAIGKTAFDMLAVTPSVWVTDEKININGRSGVRVMIDDRILNLSTEDIITYLKNLRAEDIQKIEVIPMAGADFDADSRGGIIKITMKRQRNDGIEGNVSLWGYVRNGMYGVDPYASLNYKKNKVSLYGMLYYSRDEEYHKGWETTEYTDSDLFQRGTVRMENKNDYAHGKLGAIYDINDKNSIGAEVFLGGKHQTVLTTGESYLLDKGHRTDNSSLYDGDERWTNFNAAVNYIHKLDTLGSTLKFIGDVTIRDSRDWNIYNNSARSYPLDNPSGFLSADSVSKDRIETGFRVWTAGLSLEKFLSPRSVIRAGLKFTYNFTDNTSLYHYRPGASGDWTDLPGMDLMSDYSEKISAAYAIYGGKIKNINYVLGLRGEHTYAVPRIKMGESLNGGRKKQNYFSIFPNLNISIPLNETQSNSLILAYDRKISRPNFWQLTPFNRRLSEYSLVIGNPDLDPTFNHDFSVTAVFKYQYTLTLGAQLMKDEIAQILTVDAETGTQIYQHRNIPDSWNYFMAVNLPVNPWKWWTMNVNLIGLVMRQKLEEGVPITNNLFGRGYMSNVFTLPKGFIVELNPYFQTSGLYGNLKIRAIGNFDVALKKKFLDDKLTASVTLRNALSFYNARAQRVVIEGSNFTTHNHLENAYQSRYVKFSVSYNFKAGKNFKARNVEKAGDENRLSR